MWQADNEQFYYGCSAELASGLLCLLCKHSVFPLSRLRLRDRQLHYVDATFASCQIIATSSHLIVAKNLIDFGIIFYV